MITTDEFKWLVDGIFAAHGKNAPSDRILAKWYEHCSDIPTEAANAIAVQMERATKLEANVGAQFMSLWFIWRANNPDKCAHEVTMLPGCKYCDRGWVHLVREKSLTSHVSPCGYCRPEAPGALTTTTWAPLGMSYIEPLTDPGGKRYGQALAVNKYLAGMIGQRREALRS